MKNPKKYLFSVSQMCNVCGISRSAALRLESKALSILCYGDYKTITAPVSALLTEKMKELNLKPNGYL
ncbi:MAG: hypothetical protein J1F28_10355 [Oscillospiraceae bacterium]|nr:hypothetical protein [Oscillospiraceae bacterium]